jgi:hypothetical protein
MIFEGGKTSPKRRNDKIKGKGITPNSLPKEVHNRVIFKRGKNSSEDER